MNDDDQTWIRYVTSHTYITTHDKIKLHNNHQITISPNLSNQNAFLFISTAPTYPSLRTTNRTRYLGYQGVYRLRSILSIAIRCCKQSKIEKNPRLLIHLEISFINFNRGKRDIKSSKEKHKGNMITRYYPVQI
ncbi:hypothetical protein DID88_008016 [Monilinia fructigena]|uniref:Uncharacterized protein n=1 Tax=Monilinia fructigena TaxID=38457 RepID=A0A395J959_9HELO|nr:hypothetical protein DID88_008016 [Monilinia fructigena]